MSKSLANIGVAMIGTGFMGGVHVEALRRVGVHVGGVLGSSAKKSQAAADRWGIAKGYTSYDQVLADDEVHSIHIGTPNKVHFEQATLALNAGKHIMCEKPLAMTSSETQQLVELAASKPELAAGVNYNIRFYPLAVEMREQVRDGRVGDLFHVTGGYVQDWLHQPDDYNWRVLAEEGGELRAIADIGTHWLDLVHAVTGLKIESVCADLQTVHPSRQRPLGEVQTYTSAADQPKEPINVTTEDAGSVLIRFIGGARGTLHVSQTTAGRKNCLRLEVAGSKSSLSWNSERPNELFIGNRDRANGMLLKDPSLLSPSAAGVADAPGGHNEGYVDTFKQCFRSFYQYVLNDDRPETPPFATFADGHREVLLCEAILQSHKERRWVNISL